MSDSPKPNILFLLADDQSYWSTGYNNHPEAVTPHIDALASEGLIFDRHYVTSPICMASRASIATGLYEYRTGCNFEHGRMSPDMFKHSYHMLLRRAGYYIGYAGKFGFGVDLGGEWPAPEYYNDQATLPGDGFDWWKGLPGQGYYRTADNESLVHLAEAHPHLTGALAASTADFLDNAANSGNPFCLTVGFKAPHGPLTPDPAYNEVFRAKQFPFADNYGEPGADHLSAQAKTGRQWENFRVFWEEDRYQESYRLYFQLIHGLDCAVGAIRQELVDRGLAENTVIIFSSDNGFFCGSHRMTGKVLAYDEASRVPMIVYDPRSDPKHGGTRIAHLTGCIDIAPTILDLAEVEKPDDIDGKSLVPLLANPNHPVRTSLNILNFWNMPPTQGLSVTDGTYKYIYYWYRGDGMEPSEELYCLTEDPGEMINIVDIDRAPVAAMRHLYDEAVAHVRAQAVMDRRYEHYGILLDRTMSWAEKELTYTDFFDQWVTSTGAGSWRGGTWFEDLDLSNYPVEVTYSYGIPPTPRE